MADKQVAPYGSWKSPINAAAIASGSIRLGQVELDGGNIYWNESRPLEGGRYVVVRCAADGKLTEFVPPPFNARTRVHEYGGGSYLVIGGTVYFSNFADQRLYRADGAAQPAPVTAEGKMRYADGILDRFRNRLILVREDHTLSDNECVNTIVALNPDAADEGVILVSGNDFYSAPRLSPDGKSLAWLTWNHPHMPWEAAELWVAPVAADGALGKPVHIAGSATESIVQPEWSPDGVLYFISDRTGWWNLYRLQGGAIEPLAPLDAEFAAPSWGFRMSSYAFAGPDRILCSFRRDGSWSLALLDTVARKLTPIETGFSDISDVRAENGMAAFIAGSPTTSPVLYRMDLATGRMEAIRRASSLTIDPDYISVPQSVEFPTEGGLTAHGFFYAPKNRDFSGPAGEKPPLLVKSHGGPTSAAGATLSLTIQYYTSRGVAVLDVNYGGSSGYGRPYRERLNGQWGVVDVDDCCNGALHFARAGQVDPNRLAITGGSAGGYTTLAALTFRRVFHAGASHFGVSDCELLVQDTHKFEAHYLDSLIGPYPQRRDLYLARSPIHHVDNLNCPVIFFQGLEDKIVPPNQAEKMVAVLRTKKIPVAYVPFPGEQHGFRRAENIQRSIEGELYFLSRIFRFTLADAVAPVAIENLDDERASAVSEIPHHQPVELQFPLEWHGKIIAHDRPSISSDINRVLSAFDISKPAERGNVSAGGKYVTYNVRMTFTSREMMNEVIAALADISGVRMVL